MRRLIVLSALVLAPALAWAAPAPPPAPRPACPKVYGRTVARDTGGNVVFGPSRLDEVVIGQRDAAGNLHVDPRTASCLPARLYPR